LRHLSADCGGFGGVPFIAVVMSLASASVINRLRRQRCPG
jgi:hypothetical protein